MECVRLERLTDVQAGKESTGDLNPWAVQEGNVVSRVNP